MSFRENWSWKWIRILTFGDSRKAGFGLWLAIIATFFLLIRPIYLIIAALFRVPKDALIPVEAILDAEFWFLCISISATMLGVGTIVDKRQEIKKMQVEKGQIENAPANPS
jgi:hypothetical protein